MADEGLKLKGYLLAKRYRISDRLGAGGMGEVWLATDIQLGREVAIKFILPGFAQTEWVRHAFINEARLVARLDHPHIVTVYDMGTENIKGQTTIYVLMKYAPNGTLSDRMRRGPLPLGEVNRIMAAAIAAVMRPTEVTNV